MLTRMPQARIIFTMTTGADSGRSTLNLSVRFEPARAARGAFPRSPSLSRSLGDWPQKNAKEPRALGSQHPAWSAYRRDVSCRVAARGGPQPCERAVVRRKRRPYTAAAPTRLSLCSLVANCLGSKPPSHSPIIACETPGSRPSHPIASRSAIPSNRARTSAHKCPRRPAPRS
jgi:hypothetical protein